MLFRRPKTLSPSEACGLLGQGDLQLVDVREQRELAEARIPGAIHIPLGEVVARVGALDPALKYAFVCRSGKRSAAATRIAATAGLDAANVRGGVTAWMSAGLPLTTTKKGDRR